MSKNQSYYDAIIGIVGTSSGLSTDVIVSRMAEIHPELQGGTVRKLLYNMESMSYPLLVGSRKLLRSGVTVRVYSVSDHALHRRHMDVKKRWPDNPARFDAEAIGYTWGNVPTLRQLSEMLVAAVNQPYGGEV